MRFVAHAASLAVISSLCNEPRVGPQVTGTPPPPSGPEITLSGATVNDTGHVVVTYAVTRAGAPLARDEVNALAPAWTLAAVEMEPVSTAPAWRSLILTGDEVLKALPVAGPGTPLERVLADARQPGAESLGAVADLGNGTLTYTFEQPLPTDVATGTTLRAGVFLRGVNGSARTSFTFDFVRGTGTVAPRDTVVLAACERCHGTITAHEGSRSGVGICVTCHTYQHADADTVDPAAPIAATADTNPNPLEFGRLVHRIHRGKRLPTLYSANVTPIVPEVLFPPTGLPLALPFSPSSAVRNPPLLGQKFRVVGELGRDRVYGKIVSRTDNGQPAKTVVAGVTFPQDLRNCDACHGASTADSVVRTEISRRSCHGCHPDVWFEAAPAPDAAHVLHPGGAQLDDRTCRGCHVAATVENPVVWAPIAEAHVPQYLAPRLNQPTLTIVSISDFKPGMSPTIVFEISDRKGKLLQLDAPDPAMDDQSPVPRKITSASFTLGGPTTPDFSTTILDGVALPLRETLVGTGQPAVLPVASGERFTYTLATKIPPSASGTWTVAFEVRRTFTPPFWDATTGRFNWPFTGESLSETADNVLVDVDLTTGTYPGTTAVPRRKLVSTALCARCHLRLANHGGGRNQVEYCLLCHTPDKTDWTRRQKGADGNVLLGATFDGIEERSVQLKTLVHRIHAGGHTGPASLDHTRPFVVYGYSGAKFFDEGEFPNELSNCRLCHADEGFRLETIPRDAPPTLANETGTIRHAGTIGHSTAEAATPAFQAACGGCHGNGASNEHFRRYTVDGRENCVGCHGDGRTLPVNEAHQIIAPPT
jgi:OmcA/MtrC family decaheme c-type cytochrome